ncbi:hypothetical protein B9X71_07815 [Acinetobacter baumannii]|uniref:DUF1090 family protein n=1 Tax=Acinetobacter baumannii TaxID=470 RepID=UPI000A33A286|nr:DUF1090 family protein [Acinetobacter baumannii]MCT9166195.1 DUF1090 domain-containing protein [Acinetobacter baumannii]MCT9173610.1 DUF1090 domain-containing protein [Acinetobacter baumannii]MCT9179971.1 DUF1090 domain-containing protein [Acinetobacter baumannii]OTK48162.1 hypothetical protein B9X71_07815 [Acinetobacter baumannii]
MNMQRAEIHGKTHKTLGLLKALTETADHCHDTNAKVLPQQTYLERQRKVAKIEAELLKATESTN